MSCKGLPCTPCKMRSWAALEFPDLAPCVVVVPPTTKAPEAVQTNEGRFMEALPDVMPQNLAQQTVFCQAFTGNTNCCKQEEQQQQQQQQQQPQQCRTSGLEPLSDRLFWQGLLPTPIQVMCLSILLTMQKWNFYVPRVSCCRLHSSIVALRCVVESLALMKCQHLAGPTHERQCQCGLIMFEECNYCSVCDCLHQSSSTPIQEKVVAVL